MAGSAECAAQARCVAVERFYREHGHRLGALVARHVHAPVALIEDACQVAGATLLGRPDIDLDHRGVRWLTTVAVREAWRQASSRREVPAGAFVSSAAPAGSEPGVLCEPAGPAGDPADVVLARAEHDRRVGDLRALKPCQRQALYLHELGYSYREICQLTASSYTAVNRRLTEGRARLRELADRGED